MRDHGNGLIRIAVPWVPLPPLPFRLKNCIMSWIRKPSFARTESKFFHFQVEDKMSPYQTSVAAALEFLRHRYKWFLGPFCCCVGKVRVIYAILIDIQCRACCVFDLTPIVSSIGEATDLCQEHLDI